jgi:bifunctional UDP-N-acetylglucosamine pyrophosphorylase/glucosamine-1-phosphate N-acetyltransferase
MRKACAVVLAAGRSTRMGFNKLLGQIAGHPMVWYPIAHLKSGGFERIIVVLGHDRIKVKDAIGDSVEFVIQEEQKGTGHATGTVMNKIKDEEDIIILFGDCPFLDTEIIQQTYSTHLEKNAGITLATARMKDPRYLGRIRRNTDGAVLKIVDGLQSHDNYGMPSEIFTGLSVWKTDVFKELIPMLPEKQKTDTFTEQDLPDAIEMYVNNRGKVATFSDIFEEDALGPNIPIEFDTAAAYLRVKVKAKLMANNVIIPDLHTVIVDYDVVVGANTIIRSNTNLIGNTQIGSNCEIGPDATLTNCRVENNCIIGKGTWKEQKFSKGSNASDRLATEHRHFRKPHFLIPEDPHFCFVLMPFKQPYLDLLANVIRPTLTSFGLDCKVASERFGPGVIIDEIWNDINRSKLIIAEITEPNRNVWYELGLAHALNKLVVMLSKQSADRVNFPFDIEHHRILMYDPEKGNLEPILKKWIINTLQMEDGTS